MQTALLHEDVGSPFLQQTPANARAIVKIAASIQSSLRQL
jgi:hypothetical protein